VKPKKITVTWLDHHERGGQGEATTPDNLKPMLWTSIGFLVSENDTMLELVRDISADKDVTDVGASLRIMKNSIVTRSDRKGG
jgi:hypothetical protein